MPNENIFRNLYKSRPLVDRLLIGDLSQQFPSGVDVVIPLLHSNDLWRENLLSIFREVPVSNLLIGNAGAARRYLDVLNDFPRVKILDHTHFQTLGRSIAELTAAVKTDWFLYLHSDVFLPEGWFNRMADETSNLDWFGSPQHITVLADYILDYDATRPAGPGAQMGRREVFENLSQVVDDDFVYRNEDFVLDTHARRRGFRTGSLTSNAHIHQAMARNTPGMDMEVETVSVRYRSKDSEEERVLSTQVFGLIKYCSPDDPRTLKFFQGALENLRQSRSVSLATVLGFAQTQNPDWRGVIVRHYLSPRIRIRASVLVLTRFLKSRKRLLSH